MCGSRYVFCVVSENTILSDFVQESEVVMPLEVGVYVKIAVFMIVILIDTAA